MIIFKTYSLNIVDVFGAVTYSTSYTNKLVKDHSVN